MAFQKSPFSQDVTSLMERGKKFLKEYKYEDAIKVFSNIISICGEKAGSEMITAEAYYNLAEVYYRRRKNSSDFCSSSKGDILSAREDLFQALIFVETYISHQDKRKNKEHARTFRDTIVYKLLLQVSETLFADDIFTHAKDLELIAYADNEYTLRAFCTLMSHYKFQSVDNDNVIKYCKMSFQKLATSNFKWPEEDVKGIFYQIFSCTKQKEGKSNLSLSEAIALLEKSIETINNISSIADKSDLINRLQDVLTQFKLQRAEKHQQLEEQRKVGSRLTYFFEQQFSQFYPGVDQVLYLISQNRH
jgi:hypothetical protein